MNTFDYWFDYIVRNGKFRKNSIFLLWDLRIGNFKYLAAIHRLANLKYILSQESIKKIFTKENFHPRREFLSGLTKTIL